MTEVYLRGQAEAVVLDDVEEGDALITGRNTSGKTFAARKDKARIDEPFVMFDLRPNVDDIAAVEPHPYRVYVEGYGPFRCLAPRFEEAQAWLDAGEGRLSALVEDGQVLVVETEAVQSILSAMPEDRGGEVTDQEGEAVPA